MHNEPFKHDSNAVAEAVVIPSILGAAVDRGAADRGDPAENAHIQTRRRVVARCAAAVGHEQRLPAPNDADAGRAESRPDERNGHPSSRSIALDVDALEFVYSLLRRIDLCLCRPGA